MKRVLILDDDRDLREILTTVLDAHGLAVSGAATARDAAEQLEAHAADLLIVDGLLPDGSGVEFVERVRERDKAIKIVFVSAFYRDMQTFKRLTDELDVSLVAYKPFEPVSFAATISELLTPGPILPERSPGAEIDPAAAFARELAALRKDFSNRLPARLSEIETALDAARADPRTAADARMLVHRLRGSAGTFGFPAVSDALETVEQRLKTEADLDQLALRRFFWEEIDAAMRDARLASSRAPDKPSGRIEVLSPRPAALLVVDDDPDFCHMVRAAARPLLVEVVMARLGAEALQHARSRRLCAALLDVHLDGEDSFSLARQLRETDRNAQIPIAFASVDGTIETRVAAIEAGGSRFFDKPIPEENLRGLLHHLIESSRAQQGRVLIVDDDADALAHYARCLRGAGYAVEQLLSADDLVARLERTNPDVLLLDVRLPRVSGIEVCKALRMSPRWELLPILIITALTDTETRVAAFRAGASDVIAKPVLTEELLARVSVQEQRMRLLRERADRDHLSGLWMRRAFLDAMQRAISACVRQETPLSLVLIDIDHFKQINDTHGHLAGDQVIARLGEVLMRRFRIEDLRGRWGGEEFVLAFPGQVSDCATRAAERLRHEVRMMRFTSDAGQTFVGSRRSVGGFRSIGGPGAE